MSQQSPYAPYGASGPAGAPPQRRKRPRAVWFFVGGTLLVLAPIVFVGALFTVLRPLTQEDAVFAVTDTPLQLRLAAGEERAVFTRPGDPVDCSATHGSGKAVEFRPIVGEFTVNEWTAVSRFDTGDGEVTFTCTGADPGSELRIAQLPSTGGFVAGIVIGVMAPLVLGGIGMVMLIVTGVLYATGAPRDEPDASPIQTNPT